MIAISLIWRVWGELGGRKCVRDDEGAVFREMLVDGATRHAVDVAISEMLTRRGTVMSTERSLFSLGQLCLIVRVGNVSRYRWFCGCWMDSWLGQVALNLYGDVGLLGAGVGA